jgi:hypothetical protein
MAHDIFTPALQHLKPGAWGLFGPTSFLRYIEDHKLPKVGTAPTISVDHLERLDPALRRSSVMVLRLGAATDGPGTQFALVSTPGRLADFFLHDTAIFGDEPPEPFEPVVSLDSLRPYGIFPVLTETSMVNLAFASGLIGYALGLDLPYPTAAPATGSSTYPFRFRPHSAMAGEVEHRHGQVEIDAVFVGRRQGRPHLFILEAKSGSDTRTLAKHKLVYPALALGPYISPEIPIVPVYVRIDTKGDQVLYHVVECRLPDPRGGPVCLEDLQPVHHRYLTLTLVR